MYNLVGSVRAAIDSYNMIDKNDKIAVCVSGGKDSVFLLYALAQLRAYYPKHFELIALTIDPCFNQVETDFSSIDNLCNKLKVEYIIKRSNLGELIFNIRKESNPCSLCSRIRKGMINNTAKAYGCNKIALGHNMDDAIETFLMNILNCGNISCFSPISYLSRKDIFMIRPLIFCEESKIKSFIVNHSFPIIKSTCPANGKTQRQKTKELVSYLERDYKDFKKKIIGAIQRSDISGWKKLF